MKLSDISIHAWIVENNIKNEVGEPVDFKDHMFLFDIYRDFSPKLAIMKAAQVGATTMECLKTLWGVKNKGLDSIYCLPTYEDVNTMVGSKVNRIIAQNPILQQWTKDRDTIDQKQIGEHYIHFRGTWTSKAAIMVSSDWNCYDEVDACKPDVVEQYSTRLQHSKYKYEHYFSHPSAQGTGIDKYWEKSDQKHWFIVCRACNTEQFLEWPRSIRQDDGAFICKSCEGEITDDDRRRGRWVAKFKSREYSGYWIPLLICPWVSGKEIISYHKDKSEEYFYNKVLGLPFVGGGNKLTRQAFVQNLTQNNLYPDKDEFCVMGLDTGNQLYYVLGSQRGMFNYGVAADYDWVEEQMTRWPRMIVMADQGGDLIGIRVLQKKYSGRVFLVKFVENKSTKEEANWGEGDNRGWVQVDRNRTMSQVVAEFVAKMIPVMGTEEEWNEYFMHWNNLTRQNIYDPVTNTLRTQKWVKNGQSDFPFATLYLRVGLSRFSDGGSVSGLKMKIDAPEEAKEVITPEDIRKTFYSKKENDWRV